MRFECISAGKPVSFGDLPNGVRFYGRFDRVANAGGIGVKCGSMHTPGGRGGLPHLVEHIISRSARKYSDREINLAFRRYFGGPDGDINIRIDRYSTFFGHFMLLRPTHMRICFDFFANMLKDRLVGPDSLEVERSRIQNEYYLVGMDVVEEVLSDTIHEMAYRTNPARHRIDCVPEELNAISLAEIRAFIRKHYVSRNMFMVVLGPRFKTVERMACQHFADWPDRTAPKPEYYMADGYAPLRTIKTQGLQRPGIGQHHVMIGFPVEEFGGKNHYTLRVLIHILEYLLYDQLQEHRRCVYRNPVNLSQSKWHGLLTVNFATVNFDFVDPGVEAILGVCKSLRENMVDSDVFQVALNRTFYEWVGPFVNDANKLLESIIDSAANGDADLTLLHSGRSELEKIIRKKIIDAAN